MIEIEVKVVRTMPGFAWVVRDIFPLCAACKGQAQCQSIAFTRLFCRKNAAFQVRDPFSVKIGERVIISIEEKNLLTSALKAYGMPLLLLIIGAITGKSIGLEYTAVLGGVFGLGIAMLWLKWGKTSLKNLPIIVAFEEKDFLPS